MEDYPLYEIKIDTDSKDLGVFCISVVDSPAIEKNFIMFSKDGEKVKIQYKSDDIKQIVTGPILIPDKQILRKTDDDLYYNVVMSSDTIKQILIKYTKEHQNLNSNFQHAETDKITDIVFFENWIISSETQDKAFHLGFKDLPVGTWMSSMYVADLETYNKIKEGNFNGFSIEGNFQKKLMKMSNIYKNETDKDMIKNELKNIFNKLILLYEKEEIKFEDLKLEDGTVIRIDEDGTVRYVETLEVLPDGEYKLNPETPESDPVILTIKDGKKIENVVAKVEDTKTKFEISVTLEDGTPIFIDDFDVAFKEDGTVLADGEYTLSDKTILKIEGGIVISKSEPAKEEPAKEEPAKLSKVKEELELNLSKITNELKLKNESEKTLLSKVESLEKEILELKKKPIVEHTPKNSVGNPIENEVEPVGRAAKFKKQHEQIMANK